MPYRALPRRLTRLADHTNPPIPPQFRVFARAVIAFGGHQPTEEAVEQLARWYAGRYYTRLLSGSSLVVTADSPREHLRPIRHQRE